jgi:hypothetical protein
MKTPEDDEFNRIEMESRVKQEYVRAMNKPRFEEDDDIQDYKRPWVGLTDDEYQQILVEHNNGGLILFYNLVEAKLRSKNT